MSEFRDDYDLPWKDIIEDYFQEFIQFFFPSIHSEIDWLLGYQFLDQELSQIIRDAELGKRVVDKLVKVWTQNGTETWVLLNIEIQSQEESDFSARIFTHFYRLRDSYNVPIVNLAILGDERSNWRPSRFQAAQWGCEVDFRFPIVKLLDYQDHWADLEASLNPFAIVVMAHLKTKETRKDFQARKDWKFRLTRMLYERDYDRQDIINIFRFIDWILELPEGLKQDFKAELKRYEQEKQMPYMTSIERMGMEEGEKKGEKKGLKKGRKEGRKEGEKKGRQEAEKEGLQRQRSMILRLLNRKLGVLPDPAIDQVSLLSIDQLDDLAEALLDFNHADELEKWLEK